MTEATYSLALALVDAAGGGVCRLQADGTIVQASDRFGVLAGSAVTGRTIGEAIPGLAKLDRLPNRVASDTAMFVQVGTDGVGRELSAARIEIGTDRFVVLADRSGEARLRRAEAKLDRQLTDLQAELTAREREPRRSRIRSLAEMAARLDDAVIRGRRYQHDVSLIVVRLQGERAADTFAAVGECLIGCVRGVDDIGRLSDEHWVLVLPHTNLEGGQVVGNRALERLRLLDLGIVAIGCAQVGREEPASKALERADQACADALERGGGQLLAVALV